MSLLGPDAAHSPGRVRRRRPAWSGSDGAKPSCGGDTLRRCVTVIRAVTDRGRRAMQAASLSPLQPAASRSGDDLDSACRNTSGGGTGENVVESPSTARRPVDHLEYRTPGDGSTHCQPDNGSPSAPVDSSRGPCSSRVTSGGPEPSRPPTRWSPATTSSGRTAGTVWRSRTTSREPASYAVTSS